ncbi:SGNH/GDSL hydrolase family protein [Dyadobacter sp. CY323]|uniref:SGNH/GDSL hydrolase family protein n=1 Tax=Dyadobacter sp. CY323 TaxID=2907302 RepID=UPI001F3F29CC|nr:SGNH/GDSL hydrolase family protein [Dyadobacter sp. CY323]MCE6991990.1 SGNH/GDSL hydrolase family protein [Dyadobacter sp. CY323]
MKRAIKYLIINGLWSIVIICLYSTPATAQTAESTHYLDSIRHELTIQWPKSRTVNLVFHGHSVPAGYGDRHEVNTLQSYPNLMLKKLKEKYPYAVINVIVTAIGGENSIKGQTRFENDVLVHKPDVLFIDYALNDRFSDLAKVKDAWEKMIKAALDKNIKVILLTPSPDQRIEINDAANPLEPYIAMIKSLAGEYKVGLADPNAKFKEVAAQGKLKEVMASVNHPNEAGHMIIVQELLPYF